MWTPVAHRKDLPEGGALLVEAGGHRIALFKRKGKLFAMRNACAHRGGPLVEGHVEDGKVTCPWHAWAFDLTSGKCAEAPFAEQPVFPVKLEGEEIFVDA